jgi:DNA polymerase III subunit epsilon
VINSIPDKAARIHGITTEISLEEGSDLSSVLLEFMKDFSDTDLVVRRSVSFDLSLTEEECRRSQIECSVLRNRSHFCTMRGLKDFCKIPPVGPYPDYKFPKLSEAYLAVTSADMIDDHDAFLILRPVKSCFHRS